MLTETWTPSNVLDNPNKTFFLKSTLTDRGNMIGNRRSPIEFSTRRHSIILISDGKIFLETGSVAYKTGFDSTYKYEPLRMYDEDHFIVNLSAEWHNDFSNEEITYLLNNWSGSGQSLRCYKEVGWF